MKRLTKITAILLSCLLLIGGMVGISAFADSDTTVGIYKKIISYEGAVRIAYAIEANNLEDGQSIKVAFSFNEDATAPEGKLDASDYAYVNGVTQNYEINGISYPVVFSNGFSPVELTKTVYAIPLVVDGAGNVVASGEKVYFSVFDYCTARFAADPTADQLELYTALLRYGAAVQEALLASGAYSQAELDKYGWADAYYVTNITNSVNGEVTSTSKVCYRQPDVTIEAPKTFDGNKFAGFTDKNGAPLTMYDEDKTSSAWNKYATTLPIGVTEITYNYETAGSIQTWDVEGTTLPSGIITSQAGATAFVHHEKDETKTSVYINDQALAIYSKTWNPVNIANKNTTTGSTYVFESDVKIDFDIAASELKENTRIAYFDMATNGSKGYNTHFVRFALTWDAAASKGNQFSFRYFDGKDENHLFHMNFNEWQNLRIEYEVTTLSTDGAAEGSVKIYLDGKLVGTVAEALSSVSGRSNTTFGGMHYEGNGNFGAYEILFDNTYISAED